MLLKKTTGKTRNYDTGIKFIRYLASYFLFCILQGLTLSLLNITLYSYYYDHVVYIW